MGVSKGYVFETNATLLYPGLPNPQMDILIDSDGSARVADFTFVTIALDWSTTAPTFKEGGTTRWMSPELLHPETFGLKDSRPTKESDCYGLGMVMYEVLSGQRPFAEYVSNNIVPLKIIEGNRPGRPQGKEGELFTDEIWDILKLCWKPQPRDRISASAVLLRLEKHPPLPIQSPNLGGDAKTGSDERAEWDTDESDCTFLYFIPGSSLIPLAPYRTTDCTWRQ